MTLTEKVIEAINNEYLKLNNKTKAQLISQIIKLKIELNKKEKTK